MSNRYVRRRARPLFTFAGEGTGPRGRLPFHVTSGRNAVQLINDCAAAGFDIHWMMQLPNPPTTSAPKEADA